MKLTQTMIAARRLSEKKEGRPTPTAPKGWKPADTAPKNGSAIRTRSGAIMRWMAYKPDSEQALLGDDGRWQVYRSGGQFWTNAVRGPSEWRGYSFPSRERAKISPA